jgi:DNA polymerase elongation subunit (family B)
LIPSFEVGTGKILAHYKSKELVTLIAEKPNIKDNLGERREKIREHSIFKYLRYIIQNYFYKIPHYEMEN